MSKVDKALNILRDPEAEALSLLVALDVIFKGACFAWEFDTIFEELEQDYAIVLSSEAADRLMALLALKENPAHLWDGSVFANLVETINHQECLVDTYEQCSVGEVLYCLSQLEEYQRRYSTVVSSEDFYGDEPRIYIACCVASDGWMVLPRKLEFCREEYIRTARLDKHIPQDKEEEILSLAAKKEFEVSDEDDAIHVQVAKIRESEAYAAHFYSKLKSELVSIS